MKLRYLILSLLLMCLAAPALASMWEESYVSPSSTIRSMGVFLSNPYAGTTPGGVIYYKYGTNDWTTSYATGETTVYSLVGWGTQMYAGTGEDGKIFRGSGTSWSLVNDTTASSIRCFTTYNGAFYAGGANTSQGVLYSTTDGTNWPIVNASIEGVVWDIEEFKGHLFIATGSDGEIWKYDLSTWTLAEDMPGTQVYSLELFNGYLYAATGGAGGYGRVYRSADGDTWEEVFNSGTNYVYTLETFNNRIYAGGYNGIIYTSSTGTTWETDYSTGKLYVYALTDDSGDTLFAGTGITSGTIYKLDVSAISSGAGIQYPPHSVNIKVLSFFGAPVSDATVTAIPVETTMGEWSWLQNLWGISNEVNVVGDTMTGTTDRNGVVGFVMFEEIQYLVNVTKAADGISWSQYLYPTESDYVFVVTEEDVFTGGYNVNSNLTFSVTTAEINSTFQGITIVGNDSVGDISGITVFLNVTNKTVPNKQDTVQTFTAASGNFTHTFPVTDYSGDSYIVNLNLTQGAFGEYERSFGVTFPIEAINPLNLPSDLLLKISIVILCLTGCIFTATTAHNGPILTCFIGWILLSIGFLNAMGTALATTALTAATIFSVFILIAKKKEERP